MARRFDKKRWANYVTELYVYLKNHYGERNKYLDGVHERRKMAKKVQIPKEYRKTAAEMRSALVFDTIRKAVAMLGTRRPEPKVDPITQDDPDRRESSTEEKWARASMERKDEYGNVYQEVLDAIMTDNIAVVKVGMDRHKWGGLRQDKANGEVEYSAIAPEKDEKYSDYMNRVENHHRANFPFYWENVSIRDFYPVMMGDDIPEAIMAQKRKAYPLMKEFGIKRAADGSWFKNRSKLGVPSSEDAADAVQYLEYWNQDMYVFMVDELVVDIGYHDYGRTPFYLARGAVYSTKDPVIEVMGLVAPLLSIQDQTDSLGTIWNNYAYLVGFPFFKLKQVDELASYDPESQKQKPKITPGEVATIPAGYDLDIVKLPDIGDALRGLLDYFVVKGKELGLATVLSGEMPTGDMSGPVIATVLAVAQSIFGTSVTNLNRMFDDIVGWEWAMINNVIKEPVPVYSDKWVKLGPKEIKGLYRVRHSMKHILPAQTIQQATFLSSMRNQGVPIPYRKILEDGLGESAPEKLEDEFVVEQLERRPEVIQKVMTEAFREVGWLEEEVQENVGSPTGTPMGPGTATGTSPIPGIEQPTPEGVMGARRPIPAEARGGGV